MQAIILAAGMGKRLGELTKEHTKCMVPVNGVALIDRLLSQLSRNGVCKAIIVIGYKGEKLKEHIGSTHHGMAIEYVENPVYDKTNNIYSLFLAKEHLAQEDTLLVESDLIFDDSIFPLILNCPYPNLAAVAKYETWMDGTMVKIDEDNNIINFIPKKAFSYSETDSYYKTVNIYKFSKEFSCSHYIPFLEAYTKSLGNNEYYEQVLRVITLLDKCDLKALPLKDEKWYEIDDVQDLDIAGVIFSRPEDKLSLLSKRFGGYWRFPSLLDFCYLVNPYFPPVRLLDEMRSNFDILLSEYPSGMNVNRLLAGKYFGLKKEYICIGNGAAELIKSLMEYLPGKTGITYPTFEEYPNRLSPDSLIAYTSSNADFSYTVSDLINYFSGKDIQNLLLINPDNPSGNFLPKADVLALATWTRERGITLIVDESFVDFSERSVGNTLLHNDLLEENPNLIVIKSISKSYGVPGIRLGVIASARSSLILHISASISIWNINSFGEFYLQIFGKYESDYQEACIRFIRERNRFFDALKSIPYLRVIPSQANYFLCEVISSFTASELTKLLLLRFDILIKDCSNKRAFSNGEYVRIAVRNTEDNNALVLAMKQCINK